MKLINGLNGLIGTLSSRLGLACFLIRFTKVQRLCKTN